MDSLVITLTGSANMHASENHLLKDGLLQELLEKHSTEKLISVSQIGDLHTLASINPA